MMLMMMVTLTASAQYPTTKTIKGTQVVIMTVPQAEQIDKKFIAMSDSLNNFRYNITTAKAQVVSLNKQKNSLSDTLEFVRKELYDVSTQVKFLEAENERYRQMEFEDKQVKKRVTIGVVSALVVWITLFIGGISQ